MSKDTADTIALSIAEEFFGEKEVTLSPIVGKGFENRVYKATTAHEKKAVVLRLSEEASSLQTYTLESICMSAASSLGVPCPKVLQLGNKKNEKEEEFVFMVETFEDGKDGSDFQFHNESELDFLWQQLGEYTKVIHSIGVTGFGQRLVADHSSSFSNDSSALCFDSSFPKWLTYHIESLCSEDPLLELKALTPTHSEKLKRVLKSLLKKYHDGTFKFGLTHGDLSLKNVMLKRSEDGNLRATLLDWGCAEAHVVPHFELITLIWNGLLQQAPSSFNSFLRGYGISEEEYRQSIESDMYDLLLLLSVDKLRRALDCKEEVTSALSMSKTILSIELHGDTNCDA